MFNLLGQALVAALAVSPIGVQSAPTEVSKRALKFDYNSEKVRGVNLGGWLLLEPWITPSIFEEWSDSQIVKDEWTFCEVLGRDEALRRLQPHWDSFITQDDLNQIAAAGMNHVRIPIGYWSVTPLPGEPFVQGAYERLGRAVEWASSAGLNVMIDLHGAPGSQNGFDNSGRFGPINWQKGDTVAQTLNALNKIRDDWASHPAVTAIQLLNEPFGPSLDFGRIRQFYVDGWNNLKDSNVAVVIHDAFGGVNGWNDFGNDLYNLMIDTHHYEIFDMGQVSQSPDDHIRTACNFGNQMASNNKWTIAGEWTGAMTDCTKWLNGLGKGARYDGTLAGSWYIGSCDGAKYQGSISGLTDTERRDTRRYIEAQLDGYEKRTGWIFWTWKTEGAPQWDMQKLLGAGLFPQPLTSRQFPGQCN